MIKEMLLALGKYIDENFRTPHHAEARPKFRSAPFRHSLKGAIASAKRCPRCGHRNRLYYRNASARDGLQSWCKQCQLDYQRGRSAGTAGITPVIPPEVIFPETDIAALYQQMVSASYSTDVTPLPEPQPDPQPEPDFKPHIEIPDLTGAGELAANVAAEVAGYVTGIPGLGLGVTMLKMIGDAGNDR